MPTSVCVRSRSEIMDIHKSSPGALWGTLAQHWEWLA